MTASLLILPAILASASVQAVDPAPVPIPVEQVATPDPVTAAEAIAVHQSTAEQPVDPESEDAIVVSGRLPSEADPAEAINVVTFKVIDSVDQAVIGPITHTYMKTAPKPVQSAIHNVIMNLDEPIVFLNYLLQFKPGKAVETLGRFTINTTVGLGGVMDIAKKKPFNLPRRSNGLADTMGFYGVRPGPYLMLPLIGPTTLRDVIARPLDLAIVPFAVGGPFKNAYYALGKGVISALDERAQSDERIEGFRENSKDMYAAIRDDYLKRRQAEIDVLRGKRTSVDDPTPPAKKR